MPKDKEKDYEDAIEAGLIGRGGYVRLAPKGYDEARALFPHEVIGFLKNTQPGPWGQLESMLKDRAETTVLDSLVKELADKGALHVLRHGFKCYGKTLRLAYFKPNTTMNPEAKALYDKNRLGFARQVQFTSVIKKSVGGDQICRPDVVLAVNGLPVMTVELKNELTGSNTKDGRRQYREDRDGRDLLFKFKERALVHFAVDTDEVWMTTELKGPETVFLPFNRGHNHGAGNPPGDGTWRVHYLWDEVLAADSMLDILQRFMHLEIKERKVVTDTGVRTIRKEAMIFPRYHQLDAVRRLVGHARANGAGRNYLVQHSAGSGKSNSIAWLAHRLSSLHDANDKKIFHSVVVVTDRLVLDQQLQDTIYQFEHKKGVVEKIDDDTRQLAKALADGTPVIISTIQKFPFINRAIKQLEEDGKGVEIDTTGKRFAVIVDEAHSSQSGETAITLKGVLNKSGIEEAVIEQVSADDDESLDEGAKAKLARDMLQRGRQENISFFAFTATPKFKTKAVFDEPGPAGASPFHEYTMRQAIEEGFILDVLKHYTTYKRFFGLVKQVEGDPMVPRQDAAKALSRFMNLHPVNIEQTVTVIIEHFRTNVMHELGGRAKAMVVTDSREAAVRYKLAFDEYTRKQGYANIKSLVAFSGSLALEELPGHKYTETSMNMGLSDSELPERFETGNEYRVLLVAEKYQTGFDQPLLQAMYVVKRLAGVQAVQTLSRLNRTAPGKTRTFVLDFVNDEAEIFDAFKPYYETTPMGDDVDPQTLNSLQHKIMQAGVVTPDDVTAFAQVWYRARRDHSHSDHKNMNSVLDRIVERFNELPEDDQEQYRGALKSFRSLYSFLSQVIPYQDSEHEKLYVLVRKLLMKLPLDARDRFELDDEVTLKYFRLRLIEEGSIDLKRGEADPLKGPTDVGTAGKKDDEVELSSLVAKLNDRFGTDFNEGDQFFFDQILWVAERKEKITGAAVANTLENFSAYFEKALDELYIERMEGNEDIFNRIMSDRAFRQAIHDHLTPQLWKRVRARHEAEIEERRRSLSAV